MINERERTAAAGAALANLSKNQDRVSVGHSDINKQVIYSNCLLNMCASPKKSRITLSHDGETVNLHFDDTREYATAARGRIKSSL